MPEIMLGSTPLLPVFWRDAVSADRFVNKDVLVYAVLYGVTVSACLGLAAIILVV